VVGGRVSNETNTMPLQVDVLFSDFNTPAAFALASVLTLAAVLTLLVKIWVERHTSNPDSLRRDAPPPPQPDSPP
jgi:sulfate/thiosulfate transport system permease protein